MGVLVDHVVKLQNAPDRQKGMIAVTEDHIHVIEACTPAYVRHLDNGDRGLHAHPDRTLCHLSAATHPASIAITDAA